jgi:GNAT superfamily N-acetyltransferase
VAGVSGDGYELIAVRFDAPDVYALVVAQQVELTGRDGRGDIGPARNAAMFELPDGVFLAVHDEGRAVACGGVCRFDETRAELKRMYVVPEARGRGLGRLLLEALEDEARRLGYAGIVLETGEGQQESLGLYASAGYEPIPCYGVYAGQPISRCFEKRLL